MIHNKNIKIDYIRHIGKSKMASTKTLRWTKFITIAIVVMYTNLVLTNVVSLRQRWYSEKYLNGTELQPLYDTLFMDWTLGYDLPIPEQIALRDMVDICTYVWVLGTLVFWSCCGAKPLLPAKALSAQMLLIPAFSIAQLLTIVPDSTLNCLETYDIPISEDIGWIFWRYPMRACGNMLWSSDVAQLVIFTSFATQMVPIRSKRRRWIVWMIGEIWTFLTMIFIFSSKYQYSMDAITTIIVVKLVMSHPNLEHFAEYMFVRNGAYYQRTTELPQTN
jgi:hypothetical protein